MKTFVILFLTTSLFIACGKNNKTGNGTYSYSSNPGPHKIIADDIDGDFLTSKNDPNPYIADYPQYSIDLDIEQESQNKTRSLKVNKTTLNRTAFYTDLFKQIQKPEVRFNLPDPHSFTISGVEKNTRFNTSTFKQNLRIRDTKNSSFILKYQTIKNSYFNILPKQEEVVVANKLLSNTMIATVQDFIFERNKNKQHFSEFEKSVKNNTYTVTIFDGKLKSYSVSSKLTLQEGLREIYPEIKFNKESEILSVGKKNNSFLNKVQSSRKKDPSYWILLNRKNQKTNFKPTPLDDPQLIYIKKSEIIKYASWNKTYTKTYRKLPKTLSLKNLSKADVIIHGSFKLSSAITQTKRKTISIHMDGLERDYIKKIKCSITQTHQESKTIKLTAKNIDKYLQFHINSRKVYYKEFKSFFTSLEARRENNLSFHISFKNNKKYESGVHKYKCDSKHKISKRKKTFYRYSDLNLSLKIKSLSNF